MAELAFGLPAAGFLVFLWLLPHEGAALGFSPRLMLWVGAGWLGMLVASVIYWGGEAIFLHVNPFASLAGASFLPPFADMAKTTLFKLDFSGFVNIGAFTAV